MARVRLVVHKTWLVPNPPPDLDAAIELAIAPYQLTATRVGDRIELSGGSSRKIKTRGLRLTADTDLPLVGTIERTAGPGETPTARITVHLEERLNSAILDAPTKKKYDRVLQGIVSSVEDTLSDDPASVRPVGWWSDVELGTIVKRCGVAGSKLQDLGSLVATEAGIAFTGNPKGGCRWEDLAEIEIIELRASGGLRAQVRRCVQVTSRDGEVGEFWVSGRSEPKAVYPIHGLLHASP